ncbi:DUF443 family protein [Pseudogracilibacillus sp. ICA-222130]|uniref:DUF443 family protein n=1 Tax=Pseudogracilibacillus sp. ICA-222130 TaxID=3134655 RepID=UPI0030C434B4
MIGEVERPNKNIRYKLVKINDEYYILDQDKPMWLILFPFVYWFKSHLVYQINEATYERLKHAEEKKSGKWEIVLPVVLIGPFLGRVLAPMTEKYDNVIPYILNIALAITFIIIMISVRIYVHQACYKKTDKITNGLEILPKKKIKIRPKKLGDYLVATFGYFLFLTFFLMGLGMTITYNNPVFISISNGIGFMFLIVNTIFINIGYAKIRYLDNNEEKNVT